MLVELLWCLFFLFLPMAIVLLCVPFDICSFLMLFMLAACLCNNLMFLIFCLYLLFLLMVIIFFVCFLIICSLVFACVIIVDWTSLMSLVFASTFCSYGHSFAVCFLIACSSLMSLMLAFVIIVDWTFLMSLIVACAYCFFLWSLFFSVTFWLFVLLWCLLYLPMFILSSYQSLFFCVLFDCLFLFDVFYACLCRFVDCSSLVFFFFMCLLFLPMGHCFLCVFWLFALL